ncbi:MAG TPA: GNAT family N-acetyltransferase [Telluria sp.]|nr:GNAT family N-acetyltransferase [Telluria sp.]
MEVRPLCPEDSAEVARLWHAGARDSGQADPRFLPRMSPSEYVARIERELEGGALFGWGIPAAGAHGLVAYLTARIDGASAEWSQDGHLYVCDVDVQADQRGRGHLRRLLACAREHAKARGLDRIELSWIANDPRAEAVWTRLGFRPFVQVGYLDISER